MHIKIYPIGFYGKIKLIKLKSRDSIEKKRENTSYYGLKIRDFKVFI